jgi:hypothetical protein
MAQQSKGQNAQGAFCRLICLMDIHLLDSQRQCPTGNPSVDFLANALSLYRSEDGSKGDLEWKVGLG